MILSRRRLVVASVLASLAGGPLAGAEGPAEKKPPTQKEWLIDRSLTVSPRAAPLPVFKYRLLPTWWERKPGDAVPIYLRLVHEQNDASRRRWVEVPLKWNKLPLDRLPLDEARAFLKDHRYMLHQFELAARRRKAEWNHTLDAGDPIGLLLPDVQNMRGYALPLVLQARVAMAEGDHARAVRTLETGFAMSQHVSEAPFLISSLVGVALASLFSDALLDLIERPDAPNLYWALTALPTPLISTRKAEEFEQALIGMQFPDLADLDRPRTAAQWEEVLHRVRKEYERIKDLDKESKPRAPGTTSAEPAGRSPDLAAARKYLTEQRRLPAARVKGMPPAQVLVLTIAYTYRDFSDDLFKGSFLPYPEAMPAFAAAARRLKAAPETEATLLPRYLLPALHKVKAAQNRLDRRIAALRTIEALRLHAAAHAGKLPERLSDVTEVPVPNDPGTGRPFAYTRDATGTTATLTGVLPGAPPPENALRYRLRVRAE